MDLFRSTSLLLIVLAWLGTAPTTSSLRTNARASFGRTRQGEGEVERCLPPMVPGPQGKYCYDVQPNREKFTWIGAQDFCEAKGGNLLTLHTVEDVEFLTRTMAEQHADAVYLGLRAFSNRTKWLWVDDKTEIDPTVADWTPGQPDNWQSGEHCGHINNKINNIANFIAGKFLNDVSCDRVNDVTIIICKIPLKQRAKNRQHVGHRKSESVHVQDDDDDDGYDDDEDVDNDTEF